MLVAAAAEGYVGYAAGQVVAVFAGGAEVDAGGPDEDGGCLAEVVMPGAGQECAAGTGTGTGTGTGAAVRCAVGCRCRAWFGPGAWFYQDGAVGNPVELFQPTGS